ncbi:hypothetical protein [Actomonas aquatica]|uniref:Glycosyltransferase RgtA/B/C/D-like domain-containing protein n=1 Tax=Actomonas aquatica TaxID=2866162 RepID=A0ABZ1C5Y6_9BACT|nr:hypothetical protein [Opitutus sp. WL0086]WRQ86822.1 hypothetical protein K1X11_018580 [Opitutus sp. WL0086]
MNQSPRQRSLVWIGLCLLAAVLLAWVDVAAVKRVDAVADRETPRPAIDAESPTGYVDGKRYLIPLDHNAESFQWIAQAQLMTAAESWRLREVDYDNAPRTRPVYSPSPYRWWLAALGKARANDERPVGVAIEDGLKLADPLLHWLVAIPVVVLVAWRWGAFAAAIAALGLGMTYPVLSAFYPGSPNDRSLATVAVIGAVLPLLIGATGWKPRLMFLLAGVAGAFGLWVDPNRAAPVIIGLGVAAPLAAWWTNRNRPADVATAVASAALPWRTWAIAGASCTLLAWLAENAPDRLNLSELLLRNVHPLYAVSWLGLGLVAARLTQASRAGRGPLRGVGIVELVLGLAALAALPVAMAMTQQNAFLAGDAVSAQMSPLPGAERAAGLKDWLNREGVRLSFWATALPILGTLGLTLVLNLGKRLSEGMAQATLLAAGPVIAGIIIGWSQISWWMTTGTLAVLGATALAATCREAPQRKRFIIAAAIVVLPSLARVLPLTLPAQAQALTTAEEQTLIERDLGYWLTQRTNDYRSVVLAPPEVVPSLYYYGSVRGLGSPYQGNQEGFGAAVRIAAATSPDEAEALATQRELSHIVMPNWDPFLDEYARLGAAQPQHTLVALLHNWLPPRWLRAMHHPLPEIEDFDGNGAVIFEVVDVQDNATALSRLGEYFVETGQKRFALGIAKTLEDSFPSDLGGLVARAQIAVALSNRADFERAMDAIMPYLEDARDGDLLWDRRVNLANLLMLAQKTDFAREQAQFCMDEVDEFLLRTVTPPTLHRFMLLCGILDEPFPEPELREAALRLLPPDLRAAHNQPQQQD